MAYTIILHIHNEDPVVAQVDQLPSPTNTFLVLKNIRAKDGKRSSWVTQDAKSVIFPLHKVNFIEVMEETQQQKTSQPNLVFFRE